MQEFCNGGSLRQAVDGRRLYYDPEAKEPRMVRGARAEAGAAAAGGRGEGLARSMG